MWGLCLGPDCGLGRARSDQGIPSGSGNWWPSELLLAVDSIFFAETPTDGCVEEPAVEGLTAESEYSGARGSTMGGADELATQSTAQLLMNGSMGSGIDCAI